MTDAMTKDIQTRLTQVNLPPLSGTAGLFVTASDVTNLLHRHLPTEAGAIHVRGESRVTVALAELSIAELIAVAEYDLRHRLAQDAQQPQHVSLTVKRPPMPVSDAAGYDIHVMVEPLVHSLIGEIPYRIIIKHGAQEVARRMMVFDVRLQVQVPVLLSDVRAGTIITPGHISWQTTTLQTGDRHPPKSEQIVGQAMRRDARLGDVLERHWLQSPRLVRGNQVVRLIHRSGAVTIETTGLALADGGMGDQVRIRQINERVVTAVVTGNAQATVQ